MVIYPMEIKVTIIIVVKMEGNYEIMYSLCLYINSTKGSRGENVHILRNKETATEIHDFIQKIEIQLYFVSFIICPSGVFINV